MKIGKIVLTGAAGRLGSYLREPLARIGRELVSTDLADDIGETYEGEAYVRADLGVLDEIAAVIEGAEEKARGVVQIKDLILGAQIAENATIERSGPMPPRQLYFRPSSISRSSRGSAGLPRFSRKQGVLMYG